MDTSTVAVDKFGFEDLILRGRNLSYESLPYKEEALHFHILGDKLRKKLNISIISDDILKSLELIIKNEYTNAAALLSDDNPLLNANVALIRFDGDSVLNIKDRTVLSSRSIIDQFDECMNFYSKHINTREIIEGAYRKTIEDIPKVAYREAVANAIVHRDYSRRGEIKVEIFDNRVEIVSPGGLPVGISEEEYLDGKISIPRNKVISDIFLRIGIIERLATGIRRIKEYYKDSPVNPSFEISENTIKVILPNINSNSRETDFMNTRKMLIDELIGNEKSIVQYILREGSITRRKAETILSLKKTQTISLLNTLQEKGIVIKVGSGKGTKYILNE
ncbi:MAG: hypothetical protein N4A62_00480 [Marinisporobacter sp.]|jgi:ATP-dependent DNA helicase RecG|nr:hypothetical protein [Marinisporobacter sp.]